MMTDNNRREANERDARQRARDAMIGAVMLGAGLGATLWLMLWITTGATR